MSDQAFKLYPVPAGVRGFSEYLEEWPHYETFPLLGFSVEPMDLCEDINVRYFDFNGDRVLAVIDAEDKVWLPACNSGTPVAAYFDHLLSWPEGTYAAKSAAHKVVE